MRAFISIDIPKNIQKEIKKIQEQLPEFKGKLTEPENLHLTLKFLGEQDSENIEKIKEKLKEINFKEITCNIESIGVFSENFIRIIWLKITGTEELQKIIDKKLSELKFEKEKRFMSHLTIARVKSLKNKEEFLNKLKEIKIPELTLKVDKFKLKQSILKPQGPEYKTLEEFSLN